MSLTQLFQVLVNQANKNRLGGDHDQVLETILQNVILEVMPNADEEDTATTTHLEDTGIFS
jgi:hypothetical protein